MASSVERSDDVGPGQARAHDENALMAGETVQCAVHERVADQARIVAEGVKLGRRITATPPAACRMASVRRAPRSFGEICWIIVNL